MVSRPSHSLTDIPRIQLGQEGCGGNNCMISRMSLGGAETDRSLVLLAREDLSKRHSKQYSQVNKNIL